MGSTHLPLQCAHMNKPWKQISSGISLHEKLQMMMELSPVEFFYRVPSLKVLHKPSALQEISLLNMFKT